MTEDEAMAAAARYRQQLEAEAYEPEEMTRLRRENFRLRELALKAGELLERHQKAIAPLLGPHGGELMSKLMHTGGVLEKAYQLLDSIEWCCEPGDLGGCCPACEAPCQGSGTGIHKDGCELGRLKGELWRLVG